MDSKKKLEELLGTELTHEAHVKRPKARCAKCGAEVTPSETFLIQEEQLKVVCETCADKFAE